MSTPHHHINTRQAGSSTASTAHTPGPWHLIGSCGLGFTVHGTLPGGSDTDALAILTTQRNLDGNEANARLIAAAPDLLEALRAFNRARGLSPKAGRDEAFDAAWTAARAAIAKATGELL